MSMQQEADLRTLERIAAINPGTIAGMAQEVYTQCAGVDNAIQAFVLARRSFGRGIVCGWLQPYEPGDVENVDLTARGWTRCHYGSAAALHSDFQRYSHL